MIAKTQIDLFLEKIRPYLLDYLESKGINTSSAIRCINPEHEDQSPSMLCANAEQNDWRLYCVSCGFRADIFDAYAILENKPRKGPKWFSETVLPLATMFGIPIPAFELSSEELFANDYYRCFEDVASLLQHEIKEFDSFPSEYVASKEWKQETLIALDIGTIEYETITSRLSEDDLRRFGLNRPDIFKKEHLIFTVRDQFGRPIRFFARRPTKDPKFESTTSSKLAVDLWRGKGHLYLSHLLSRKHSTVTLVEGHPDAVTAYQNGIVNVVGICGCQAFSEAHADALTMLGISRALLMYDGDQKGQEATETLLRKDFIKTGGMSYEVCVLPEEHDPDSYIRKEGLQKFNYLLEQKLSAFEYLLSKEDPAQTPEEICEKLIPYIASARSDVKREMMARDLSSFTGERVSIGAILSDVSKVDELVFSALMEKQKAIVGATIRQVQNHTPQAKEIFRDALEKLETAEKEQGGKSSKALCLSRLQSCKMLEETRTTGGYILQPGGLKNLSDLLKGGDYTGSKVVIVGGVRNVGKSTFVDNFIWQAINIPENDAIAYLLTIDDPTEARFRRMGCCAVNEVSFTQNMMANPGYYADELGLPDVWEKREYAYSRLTELIAKGKLIIEDSRDGTTLAYAERRVSQIRRENPKANIIFGLDNFHDCTDWSASETKDPVGRKIKYGKRICEIQKVLGLFTAEYKKLSDPSKPGTDDDLADCLVGDSILINYSTGEPIKLKDVQPGMLVQTIDEETFKFRPQKILRKFVKGLQPCFRLTFSDGSSLECTSKHKLLKDNGTWPEAGSLNLDDFVATPSYLSQEEYLDISNNICRFLGYLTGDGSYGKRETSKDQKYYTPRFTNGDKDIIEDFENIIESEFQGLIQVNRSTYRNAEAFRLSRTKGTNRENSIRTLLKELEIDGQTSSIKTIPLKIFRASCTGKANYIAGLFSTDGTVDAEKGSIRFSTTSKELAYNLKTLLLQLGIRSTITTSKKDIYELLILSASLIKFCREIPLVGKKKQKADKIIEKQPAFSQDNLPPYFSERLFNWRKQQSRTVRISLSDRDLGYQVQSLARISNRIASLIPKEEFPNDLNKYLSPECKWISLRKIESIGEKEVFDIEVEETHNFVANGIVTHNSRSMSYAPHLTLHLYSDLDYKGEENALLIHKEEGVVMPRVAVSIGKNKINSIKGSNVLAYDLFPGSALLKSVSIDQAKSDERTRREEIKKAKESFEAQYNNTDE